MTDTQQYSLDSLVKVVDDWARRHRIKREAANEVGMALEKVCDHYEARLRGLEANRAMWDDEAIVNAMEADAYFDGKDSGYGEGVWVIASEDAVDIARQIRDSYATRLAAADAAYTELAGMLAETERERDAAVYTLALRNPDALAGDIRQWVVDATQRLKTQDAELVTLRQELDRLNADLEAGQTFMVPNALTDEQRAMWKEFYDELNKRVESEDADNGK